MLKTYITVRESFIRVLRNDEGASLAEYALIIALVLIGAGVALTTLTNAVSTALGNGEACLEGTLAACDPAP